MLKTMFILLIAAFLIYNGATRINPNENSTKVQVNVTEHAGFFSTNSFALAEIAGGVVIVIAVIFWGKFKKKTEKAKKAIEESEQWIKK